MQTEQFCWLFLYGFLPQKNTLEALKPLNFEEALFQELCFDVTGQIHLVAYVNQDLTVSTSPHLFFLKKTQNTNLEF